MKHVFSILTVACVAFFTLFLSTTTSSCKKGDTGPKGDTGTANVMYSPWLAATFNPATDSAGNVVAYASVIKAAAITKGILDTGFVKVYWNANTPSDPAVVPLPLTDYYAYWGVDNINVFFAIGEIDIYANANLTTVTQNGVKLSQFRYIIIPGSKYVTGRSIVNWNNYEAVKTYLGLKD